MMINVVESVDWVMFGKEMILPIILGLFGFWGGRKSTAEKFKLELESFKDMRDLLISDNKALVDEIKEMRKEMKDLKKQLNDISNENCQNTECQNRRRLL